MASSVTTPNVSAPPAERFFRTSLSLLVLTSVLTLVSTGKLDVVTSFAALRHTPGGGAFPDLRYPGPLLQRIERPRRAFPHHAFFRGNSGRGRSDRGHHVPDSLFCLSSVRSRYFRGNGITPRSRRRRLARPPGAIRERSEADSRAESGHSECGRRIHPPGKCVVFLFSAL